MAFLTHPPPVSEKAETHLLHFPSAIYQEAPTLSENSSETKRDSRLRVQPSPYDHQDPFRDHLALREIFRRSEGESLNISEPPVPAESLWGQ